MEHQRRKKKIKDAADDGVDDSITTTVAGRIKKIYAAKGDDVEILSGLNSGDKVYYKFADSIEYTF